MRECARDPDDGGAEPPGGESTVARRELLRHGVRGAFLLGIGGLAGLLGRAAAEPTVWQIDPWACNQCGRCATDCVLEESAVKAVHAFGLCGYCELCTAYFEPEPNGLNTGAENQVCPTGALLRTFVEDPFFQYQILEEKCIGCAKCVKGCTQFGNGSMFLQVRHDRCKNCNECAISTVCPSRAFRRVPASRPYAMKRTK